MILTVFDTETTGFPVREGRLDQQPYIVQFAAITGELGSDKSYREISRENFIIKPGIPIPFAASQVHGIYDRDVENAEPIGHYMDRILKVLHSADVVSWHNVEYDDGILAYELERLGRKWEYVPAKTICTMRSSTEYCKLQWRGFSFKPPKLAELHKFLFDEFFEWAHDAIYDVEATMRCLVELIKRDVIKLETNNVMRLF
jgi:DNA polymerase III epsilon subunit-like protein